MKTIIGERGIGKTTEAIKLAYDTSAAIICATRECKRNIFEKCKETYGQFATECMNIFTVQEIVEGKHRGRRYNGIVIDDGDYVFEQLLNNLMLNPGFIVQFLTPDREVTRKDRDKEVNNH